MHRLPDGMNVAHQTDESFCKIAVVRQRPQRRPIPVNNDRFIVQHPLHDLPASLAAVHAEWNGPLIIRMARPYDGHREAIFPILLHQIVFTSDFVSGIGPVWIG